MPIPIPRQDTPSPLRAGYIHDDIAHVDPLGNLSTAERRMLIHDGFDGDQLDLFKWTRSATGSSSLVVDGAYVSTSTLVANDQARITTNKRARFTPGAFNIFHSVAELSTTSGVIGVAGNTRRFGVYNHTVGIPQDGVFYEVSGGDVFACIASQGAIQRVSSDDWSETGLLVTPGRHRFEIFYGNVTVHYYVDGVLAHRDRVPDSFRIEAWPLCIQNINGNPAPAEACTILMHGIDVATFAVYALSMDAISLDVAGTTVLKRGAGVLHVVNIMGAGNSTHTFYDNTVGAGTILVSIPGNAANSSYQMNMPFSNGLTVVKSAPTPTMQCSWR